MDLTALPPAVVPDVSPALVAPTMATIGPASSDVLPPPPVNPDEIGQRVANVLAKVGVDPTNLVATIQAHFLAKLEAAGAAYENAKVENDKGFWHNEVLRLTAALSAL